MTDSEILKYSKQCQPASHTVKPRKFKLRFLKYSLIRNKFRTQWMQRKGPNYALSIKTYFCLRKRNVSLRRFFYAHKTYVR